MDWTLSEIKAKIRRLTGRPDQGQISDDELKNAVNQYYVNMLPHEAPVRELESWWEFTVDETHACEEALPSGVLAVGAPFSAKDSGGEVMNLEVSVAPQDFFSAHPESETARSRPLACLLYNRTVYVRPKADALYTIKARAVKAPDPLEDDGDAPLDSKWGPLIAYGAAIEILQENGEDAEADSLKDIYSRHLASTVRKQLAQTPPGVRPGPSF